MSEPAATPVRSEAKQRLHDWIKTVIIVLVAGPPIGGFFFGLILSVVTVLSGHDQWVSVPAAVVVAMVVSYTLGLPIATVAVALFLLASRFVTQGTAYVAVVCALVSTALLIVLSDQTGAPRPARFYMTWTDFLMRLGMFGIPAGISALACWRMTRPLHRLQ